MNREFQVVQLNVRKQATVHDSLMNDIDLQNAAVLAIQEPQARQMDGRLWTAPMAHHRWTRMVPSIYRGGRWAIRSMLWVNRQLEAKQVVIQSPDLTGAIVRLRDRVVLVVSVYVPPANPGALREACRMLRAVIRGVRRNRGTVVDVVLVGDFNQHDLLWGGDDISLARQGEADPIIDLMSELALRSLLPRGTKTWQNRVSATTVDLVLVTDELASTMVRCAPCLTDHGSDHRAVESLFDVTMPVTEERERLLLKNAPWKEINARIELGLRAVPEGVTVQQKTDKLMRVVAEAVRELTPKAKPSPYTKRWWTEDLTQMRHIHTYWRNRARTERRAGHTDAELEVRARSAAKQYHDTIRQQKKSHWEAFLAEETNIWKAAKYLKSRNGASFDRIPQLVRVDGSRTEDAQGQAEELLSRFFPPLPGEIEEEGQRPQRTPVSMPDITLEEVERALFATKPWKAPGADGMPAVVWRQTWPVVKHQVLALFQQSLAEGALPTQWRHAKIIPLKKPGKENYTTAKAW